MAKLRGLLLWTDAWIVDTRHLTRLERGTYLDLLVEMWRSPGCSVPNDNNWLSRHLNMTLEEIERELRPIIAEFCQTDGNRIYQKRLQIEYEKAQKFGDSQSVRAKSRWSKKKTDAHAYAANGIAGAMPSVSVSDSKKRERKKESFSLSSESETEFAEFWTLYPRKEAKLDAKRAFAKARKAAALEQILGALRTQNEELLGREQKFRPLPASWLNAGHYLNENSPGQAKAKYKNPYAI